MFIITYFLFLFVVVYYYVCTRKEAKDRLQPNDVFLRLRTIQASILKFLKYKLFFFYVYKGICLVINMASWILRWIYSTNHKDIGTLYFIFGALAGVVGTTFSILIRIELAYGGSQIFSGNHQLYNVFVTAHAFVMLFFYVLPLSILIFSFFRQIYYIASPEVAFKDFRMHITLLFAMGISGIQKAYCAVDPALARAVAEADTNLDNFIEGTANVFIAKWTATAVRYDEYGEFYYKTQEEIANLSARLQLDPNNGEVMRKLKDKTRILEMVEGHLVETSKTLGQHESENIQILDKLFELETLAKNANSAVRAAEITEAGNTTVPVEGATEDLRAAKDRFLELVLLDSAQVERWSNLTATQIREDYLQKVLDLQLGVVQVRSQLSPEDIALASQFVNKKEQVAAVTLRLADLAGQLTIVESNIATNRLEIDTVDNFINNFQVTLPAMESIDAANTGVTVVVSNATDAVTLSALVDIPAIVPQAVSQSTALVPFLGAMTEASVTTTVTVVVAAVVAGNKMLSKPDALSITNSSGVGQKVLTVVAEVPRVVDNAGGAEATAVVASIGSAIGYTVLGFAAIAVVGVSGYFLYRWWVTPAGLPVISEVPSALPEEPVMPVSPETPVIANETPIMFDDTTILDKVASSPSEVVDILLPQYLMLGFVIIMLILLYYIMAVLAPPDRSSE